MGDLVTNGNLESYWSSDLFNPEYPNIRHLLANVPLMACRGNHEGSAALFGKYLPYPFINKYYYSFDYGPVHIALVDIYTPVKPGSEQYDWLVNDLSRSTSPWKFVCLHEPGWSAAGGHANNSLVRDLIEPLCELYNVAILFAGHNHYYARAVVKGSKGDSVVHITCGGGGAPLHTPGQGIPNVVTSSKNYHFCKINIINDNLLQFEAVSDSGRVIDKFNIDRTINSIPDQEEDYHLTITPNPFNTNALAEYTLKENAEVQIILCDLTGNVVKELLPKIRQDQGSYKLNIDRFDLTAGVYICKMMIEEDVGVPETVNRKIVITK
jgi:hypothetical protein